MRRCIYPAVLMHWRIIRSWRAPNSWPRFSVGASDGNGKTHPKTWIEGRSLMSGNCAEVTGNLSGVRIGGDVQSVQFACDCVTLTLIRGALLDYYESTVQSSADYSPVDDNSLEFAEVVPVGRLDGAG